MLTVCFVINEALVVCIDMENKRGILFLRTVP